MDNFEDKIRVCNNCRKKVLIKFNQIGGFWWLNGYEDCNGDKHYGGFCPDCFDKLKEKI